MTEFLKSCKTEKDIEKLASEFTGYNDPLFKTAETTFLSAVIGFLVGYSELYDKPYAQIEEITGGILYEAIDENIYQLTKLALPIWIKNDDIKLFSKTQLDIKENNITEFFQLETIFENLRYFEATAQMCNIEQIKKPYCLKVWDEFKLLPEKIKISVIAEINMNLSRYFDYPISLDFIRFYQQNRK